MVKNVMYLSPHLDDAVLSCGGLIHRQTNSGTAVLVVTVFAGAPSGSELSDFAAALQADWGHLSDPVSVRRQEDEQATRLLGAAHLHLDYPDAVYRSDDNSFLYLCDEALFGTPHPSDFKLISQITEDITEVHSPLEATLYAPLAVGGHVDHQLLRDATLTMYRRSYEVIFYEDYPYVEVPGALTRELARIGIGRWTEEVAELDEQDLALKTDAIAAYKSQMATVFGGAKTMAQRVRDYALALDPGHRPAERYWRLSSDVKAAKGSR